MISRRYCRRYSGSGTWDIVFVTKYFSVTQWFLRCESWASIRSWVFPQDMVLQLLLDKVEVYDRLGS